MRQLDKTANTTITALRKSTKGTEFEKNLKKCADLSARTGRICGILVQGSTYSSPNSVNMKVLPGWDRP